MSKSIQNISEIYIKSDQVIPVQFSCMSNTNLQFVFRYVKFAVLVITFFLVALSGSIQARAKKSRNLPKMVCTTQENAFQRRRMTNEIITSNAASSILDRNGKNYNFDDKDTFESSFWLRNACHNGFVVIKEHKRVLAQHEGLTQQDKEGKKNCRKNCRYFGCKFYRNTFCLILNKFIFFS